MNDSDLFRAFSAMQAQFIRAGVEPENVTITIDLDYFDQFKMHVLDTLPPDNSAAMIDLNSFEIMGIRIERGK